MIVMTVEYEVVVYRDGHWWGFELPALTSTTPTGKTITASGQARRISEIEFEARDIAAMWTDQPIDDVTVALRFQLPGPAADYIEKARELDAQSHRWAAQAAELRKNAANELVRDGLSQTDTAALLGLSRQRVGQLLHAA
jgi:hypothetical protein